MKARADCRLVGRWRIVKADLWDRNYLDLCGPATLTITAQGGKIAFGAMEAGLEVEYARDSLGFRWAGCDEGDEVRGEGTAELLNDGTIEIELGYDNGDEAVLKAKRDPSSTACSWPWVRIPPLRPLEARNRLFTQRTLSSVCRSRFEHSPHTHGFSIAGGLGLERRMRLISVNRLQTIHDLACRENVFS